VLGPIFRNGGLSAVPVCWSPRKFKGGSRGNLRNGLGNEGVGRFLAFLSLTRNCATGYNNKYSQPFIALSKIISEDFFDFSFSRLPRPEGRIGVLVSFFFESVSSCRLSLDPIIPSRLIAVS